MDEQLQQLITDCNGIIGLVFRTKNVIAMSKDIDNTDEMKQCYNSIISELIQMTNEKIEALYEKYSK